jgi:adenylate kinase family enzyme
VRNRLAEQLPPLNEVVDHYRRAGILAAVDGRQSIEDVTREVLRAADEAAERR